jgi:polysaccharide chain length determinant protein (PEP-CTERM system associated)
VNDTEKPPDLRADIEKVLRRKWCIIIPLVCSILISFGVYKILPKIYKATTVILVQPQTIPESYVRSTVTATVLDRLSTISQEILSRTTLEKVIDEFNLYADLRKKLPMEVIVAKMAGAIDVSVLKGVPIQVRSDQAKNAFSISYEGEEPRTLMMVTNKLASLFIEQNLRVRELQVEGTSKFLIKELSSVEEQLAKKEQELKNFRQRYMGELPQQLDANLRILEGLQQQLKRIAEGIRAAEDRGLLLQNQMDQLTRLEPSPVQTGGQRDASSITDGFRDERTPEDPIITEYNLLKKDLRTAQSKYTESHPDIMILKNKLKKVEPTVSELLKQQEAIKDARFLEFKAARERTTTEKGPIPIKTDPATERLLVQNREQYNAALLEAKRWREEEKNLKEQILQYQKRIENIPNREQELLLVSRDYDLLKGTYHSLMDKKIQSEMAENLERKQQAEQFKILDPARIPAKPIKPDLNRILLVGSLIGLVSGLGLAWVRGSADQSFYTVADLESHLKLSVLADIPNLEKEKV